MEKKGHFSPRTDLAVEARDMIVEKSGDSLDKKGIISTEENRGGVKVSTVKITSDASVDIGKQPGTYVTIYTDSVKRQDTDRQQMASKVLAEEIGKLLEESGIEKGMKGLVVGLGNWQVTPDALGPMTIEQVLVTNHLFELEVETVHGDYRPVAAVSPGVMGLTGMETSDIIFGIAEKFKPDFIIAIDALAARAVERLNETIQLSNAGIHPGSGIGNKRKAISKETLGVPVFALGVPTVVDAATIASDTMDDLLKYLGRTWENDNKPSQSLVPGGFHFGKEKLTDDDMPDMDKRQVFMGMVGTLSDNEKRELVREVLGPIDHNLIVTPKEVDGFMEDMSHVIAAGINAALHGKIAADRKSVV